MNAEIVIVNHSVELGRLFSHMLNAHGYPVCLYHHWPQALYAAARHQPSVIVLDKHLTDGAPRSMCAQLREHCPDTPVLMWGLDWTPEQMRELSDCGVRGFLNGAVPAETLAAHVHHVVHGYEHRKIA